MISHGAVVICGLSGLAPIGSGAFSHSSPPPPLYKVSSSASAASRIFRFILAFLSLQNARVADLRQTGHVQLFLLPFL